MPNWVKNNVRFNGTPEQVEKIKELVKSDDNQFDFNGVIPMPQELNVSAGSDESISVACATAKRKHKTTCQEYERMVYKHKTFDEYAELGETYLSNKEKYGASTWYDWCCDNWGTKWNACDAYWNDNEVSFQTAWSAPEHIFRKLSELFPDVPFEVEFADEDLGNNCGTITYEDGQFDLMYDDTFEFACNVWGYDPEELREEEEAWN